MGARRSGIFAICYLLIGFTLIASDRATLHAADAAYPNRAINVVVPLPPGGVTDLSARLLSGTMEKLLRQPIAVVNKPGGASTIGGYAVASAKPDGFKAKGMDLLLTYENTATFEKSIQHYKEVLHAFFVEEGLIKGK